MDVIVYCDSVCMCVAVVVVTDDRAAKHRGQYRAFQLECVPRLISMVSMWRVLSSYSVTLAGTIA